MDIAALKPRLFGRVAIAHLFGLWVTGMVGSIGTSAGFDPSGGVAVFLGGMLSIPWIAILAILLWFYPRWIDKHPLLFVIAGPPVVWGSYALTLGGFAEAVALSCAASSGCYLMLLAITAYRRRRTTMANALG